MMKQLKTLILLISLLIPVGLIASDGVSSIDTLPIVPTFPKRLAINGVPVVAYTLEQDYQIIKCMVQRVELINRIKTCDELVDSFTTANTELSDLSVLLYEENFNMRQTNYKLHDLNEELNRKNITLLENAILFDEKIRIIKKRNRALMIIGGIIITGLTTAVILK